jgi:hypothetical protein
MKTKFARFSLYILLVVAMSLFLIPFPISAYEQLRITIGSREAPGAGQAKFLVNRTSDGAILRCQSSDFEDIVNAGFTFYVTDAQLRQIEVTGNITPYLQPSGIRSADYSALRAHDRPTGCRKELSHLSPQQQRYLEQNQRNIEAYVKAMGGW